MSGAILPPFSPVFPFNGLFSLVASLQNLPEIFDLNLGVKCGGSNRAVSQKGLDMPEVNPSLEKMGRAGIPQTVGVDPVRQPGSKALTRPKFPERPKGAEGLYITQMLCKGRRLRQPGGGSRSGQCPISAHLSDSDAS